MMIQLSFLSFLLLILPTFPHFTYSMRVLVYPTPGGSHAKSMYPIAEELAAHGHEAVMFQMVKEGSEKITAPNGSNVEDRYLIVPRKPGERAGKKFVHSADFIWKKDYLPAFSVMIPWRTSSVLCKEVLENEAARREFYAKVREEKWDLLIVDEVFTPCGMLAAEEMKASSNATVIGFGTTVLMPRSLAARGVHINFGAYPSIMRQSPWFDHRTFSGRFVNVLDFYSFHLVQLSLDYVIPYWLDLPASEYTMPSLFAAGKVSAMLLGSVPAMLEFAKPTSNDIVALDTRCPPVVSPTTPHTTSGLLPEKYRAFIEDPKSKGTILFAMGHVAHWDGAPAEVTRSFLAAFANLTAYRIIWQFATQERAPIDAPPNVLIEKWVPQSAILYHPKTKLFISHFGMKSFRETICAGVPALAFPLFAEQAMNAAIGHKKGVSVFLDKSDLSSGIVYDRITEILNNDSYSRNVNALKNQLEDRIIKPMELGRFWSEFLVRRKDDIENGRIRKYFHMRRASEQKWNEKGNLDIILLGVVIFVMAVIMVAT